MEVGRAVRCWSPVPKEDVNKLGFNSWLAQLFFVARCGFVVNRRQT